MDTFLIYKHYLLLTVLTFIHEIDAINIYYYFSPCGRYASRSLQSRQPCECNISLTSQVCFCGASDWSERVSCDFHLFLKGDVTQSIA